jgi:hypothetical protein
MPATYPCPQCNVIHTRYEGCRPPGVIVNPHVFEYVPEINLLAYLVAEQCSQCHRLVKETVSGVCLDCDYVNRVTASKPA